LKRERGGKKRETELRRGSSKTLPQPKWYENHLSVGGVLGDGLGALRDGVLRELTGKEEADGSLDLARREGVPLVVASKAGGLNGNALEDIVDERVHDGHGAVGDTSLGVDLLQNTVDVGRIGFMALLLALLLLLTFLGYVLGGDGFGRLLDFRHGWMMSFGL